MSTSSGIPSSSLANESNDTLDPFQPPRAITSRSKNLPVPPFLVPAILDGLRASERYSGITYLVPGEADAFCAGYVRQHGGTILTSDSDLLLYNLGPEGNVAFLKDVDFNKIPDILEPGSRGPGIEPTLANMSGLVFTTKYLTEKLSLTAEDGLLSLGFELQTDPYQPFSEVIKRSKARHSSLKDPEEYKIFVSQYRTSFPVGLAMPPYLLGLDARISEFILQWTGDAASYNAEAEESAKSEIDIFLPPLLDRWDRTSAWESSVSIRQIAYGLMSLYTAHKGPCSVAEYRRTQSKISKGRLIVLFSNVEILESSQEVLDSIRKIKNDTRLQGNQWLVLSMHQDLLQNQEQEKEALTLEQWRLAAKSSGQLDATSWDTIHFTAQIQGYLYSFRILQQVLGYLRQVMGDVEPKHQKELRDELAHLPAISDFPTIGDLSTVFSRLRQSGGLELLREMGGLVSEIPFEAPRARKNRKRARDRKTNRSRAQHRGTIQSSNPFDILG